MTSAAILLARGRSQDQAHLGPAALDVAELQLEVMQRSDARNERQAEARARARALRG